jgi:hypothetical protein
MALLNAYLAYKYYATKGFSNLKSGLLDTTKNKGISAIAGYCPGF